MRISARFLGTDSHTFSRNAASSCLSAQNALKSPQNSNCFRDSEHRALVETITRQVVHD
jgi:hypothetical protein